MRVVHTPWEYSNTVIHGGSFTVDAIGGVSLPKGARS